MCSQGAISTTAEVRCQNVCTTLPRGPLVGWHCHQTPMLVCMHSALWGTKVMSL